MVAEETVPLCISGLPRSIDETQIKSELIDPLELNVSQIYIDKRRDGSVKPHEQNYVKCYLNVKTDNPVKKICSTIHKSDFSRSTNLSTVRPIALIPVAVREICEKSGTNIIEDDTSNSEVNPGQNDIPSSYREGGVRKRKTNYEEENKNWDGSDRNTTKRSFEESDERSASNDQSGDIKTEPTDSKEDNSDCVYLSLTGLDETATEDSVRKLFTDTKNEAKEVHFDSSGEKLKTFVRVPVSAGAGLKRFCAFLCKELTAQAGVKVNVKQVDSLPQNLTKNPSTNFYSRGNYEVNKREKQEKQWGWVDKSQNNKSSEHYKNFENENGDSNFQNSYDSSEKRNENNRRNYFSNNFKREHWSHPPKFLITQISKPIIYYDPTNPEHKCYELNSDDESIQDSSKKVTEEEKLTDEIEETLEVADEKLPTEEITDLEQTENLKSVFAETKDVNSAAMFSFGFHETDDNENEIETLNTEELPQVEQIQEVKPKKPKLMFTLPSLEEMKSVSFYNPKPSKQKAAESKALSQHKKNLKFSNNRGKSNEHKKKHWKDFKKSADKIENAGK